MNRLIVICFIVILASSCIVAKSSPYGLYYQNGFYKTQFKLKKSGKILFKEMHFESGKRDRYHGESIINGDTITIYFHKFDKIEKTSYILTDSCLQEMKGERCIFYKVNEKQF